jgi:uncharacterized protein DUF5615
MPLSLYLDDCADDDILATLLHRAGHQVHTSRSAGTSGVSDDDHLAYAARQGHILLTKDPDDFLDLHRQWRATNRDHSGILLVYGILPVSLVDFRLSPLFSAPLW